MSICPETVFVVEDKFGLCGYGVAAADGRHFYDQYKDEWLPKVRTQTMFILNCSNNE